MIYTHEGRSMSAYRWAKEKGIGYQTLIFRLHAGWTFEKAITTPIDITCHNKTKRATHTSIKVSFKDLQPKQQLKINDLTMQFKGFTKGRRGLFAMFEHACGFVESFTAMQFEEAIKKA